MQASKTNWSSSSSWNRRTGIETKNSSVLHCSSLGSNTATFADQVDCPREHANLSRRLPQSWHTAKPVPSPAFQPARQRCSRSARSRIYGKAVGPTAQRGWSLGRKMDLWFQGLLPRVLYWKRVESSLIQISCATELEMPYGSHTTFPNLDLDDEAYNVQAHRYHRHVLQHPSSLE